MHVIYITGLGDRHPVWQVRAVMKTWRLYGITPHFFRVGWGDGESLQAKLDRLERLIDTLHNAGNQKVGIVSVSAGASLALHLYAVRQNKVAGVVTICGKLLHPEGVGKEIRRQNPAFHESMEQISGTIQKLSTEDRKKILCVYPLVDRRVPVEDQYIEAAHKRRAYTLGHVFSIAVQLIFGARKNIAFLQQVERASRL